MNTNTPIFTGAATALITPLNENGIDFDTLGRLIDDQIAKGIDALVIAGTTGEGSTLSDEEHRALLDYSIQRIDGRVPAIAGTGSNDTAYAISLTKYSCELGYDGMLVVTPYYNKATQNGLVAMYNAIADASDKPIILYNVPSRTGINIEPATYLKLSEHPMIRAIKEANSTISKIVETFALVGDRLDIYSGNDDQIIPIMALGGKGVISVLSNVMPSETSRLCHLWLDGNTQEATRLQLQYMDLIGSLFCEVNPIPVKAAMARLGWGEDYVRLPLTPMEDRNRERLYASMQRLGLI